MGRAAHGTPRGTGTRRAMRGTPRWWALGAGVALLAALSAGCGTAGQGRAGASLTSGATTTSTTAPSPTSSMSTPYAQDVMPSSELKKALATSRLEKSYTVDVEDAGDYWIGGGLGMDYYGEFVSGDPGCLTMFNSHQVSVEAFAYVGMSNKSTELREEVESYAAPSDAQEVMAENVAQAKTCHTLKVRTNDETVTMKHRVAAQKSGALEVFHHFLTGHSSRWLYDWRMVEVRLDGEMMHLSWSSSSNADPSAVAVQRFVSVVDAYRTHHPRQASGSGPVGALATP